MLERVFSNYHHVCLHQMGVVCKNSSREIDGRF
jgi:hypothetical protein